MVYIMIRLADINDVPHLLEIEKHSFLPCDRLGRKQFLHPIKKGTGTLLVWNFESNIIKGYIYILKIGRIYSLAVHPDYRNQNVARDLLRFTEILYAHLPTLTLEVRKNNKIAQSFYMKSGYISCGIRDNYYSDGMDAIIFKKDLDNAKGRLAAPGDTV